eukprot:1357113-Pyramimonas_sp.AAC.1
MESCKHVSKRVPLPTAPSAAAAAPPAASPSAWLRHPSCSTARASAWSMGDGSHVAPGSKS